jgi:hypothetical protein
MAQNNRRKRGSSEELDEPRRCSVCDSPRLIGIEGEYNTGVYAPDGGAERRMYIGVKCLDCGAVEEV